MAKTLEARMITQEEGSKYVKETLNRIEKKVDDIRMNQDNFLTKEVFETRWEQVEEHEKDLKALAQRLTLLFGALILLSFFWPHFADKLF